MSTSVQYIINKKGHRTSVVVPFNTWKKINDDYQKLLNKVTALAGVREGLIEIKKARRSGKQLQTLNSFLDECDD